jgi:hypothetical protein
VSTGSQRVTVALLIASALLSGVLIGADGETTVRVTLPPIHNVFASTVMHSYEEAGYAASYNEFWSVTTIRGSVLTIRHGCAPRSLTHSLTPVLLAMVVLSGMACWATIASMVDSTGLTVRFVTRREWTRACMDRRAGGIMTIATREATPSMSHPPSTTAERADTHRLPLVGVLDSTSPSAR